MAETLRELVVALSLDSSNFSRNMRTINQQIKEAESTFRLAGAGVENYEKTIAGTESKLSMLGQKLTQQQRAVEQYSRALVAANDKLKENYDRHQDYTQRLEQAKARQEDLRFEVEAATYAYENYRDSLGETDSATIAAKQNLERYQEEYADATAEVTKLEGQVKALQKTMQNSADAVSKATTDLNNAKAAARETEAEIRRLTEQLYRMQSAWTQAGESLTAISKKCETMRKILNSTPDDVLPIIEWNGTPPRSSRVRNRKTDSLKGIDYNTGIVLPDNIAEKDSFSVDLTYGCLAEGEYTLISEEKVDEFTLKQYTVDPAYDVVIGYSIQFKDKNRDLYHDDNQYWHTIRSELSISEGNGFQFEVMDGEEHSAQSVEIPGMDKAVFINLGMNTRLIAIRTLNKPVVVKAKPGEGFLGETTEYQYERIQLEGFTLEECMAFFSQE